MTTPLNWLTDPCYFDLEPQPVNQWVNANDLIKLNRQEEILLDKDKLNLFPIMVRRVDFVREKSSDRVLRRFPYLKITAEEKEIITTNRLLIAERCRDYFYRSENKSILEWNQLLGSFLKREFIPLPVIRCCKDFYDFIPSSERIYSSARGEEFRFIDTLTQELAYLAGIINGDGNLQKYTLRIVDFSEENIRNLHARFLHLFRQDGNILFKTPNSPELVITNLWVVRLFSFLTSQPIGIKKYHSLQEPLIFQEQPLRSYYWSGLMDSDGSYKQNKAVFSSVSNSFALGFLKFLHVNGVSAVLRKGIGDTSIVYISKESHEKLKKLLVCLHPEKKPDFQALTNSPSRLVKIFSEINFNHLINGYFNFELMEGVYIKGLSENIRKLRGELSLREFSKRFGIYHRTIKDIEEDKQGINIHLLSNILKLNGYSLMPYISEINDSLRYKMKNTSSLKLVTRPSKVLIDIFQNSLFYKHSIILQNDPDKLRKILYDLFDFETQDTQIKNQLLLKFFSSYCILKTQ